MARSTDRIAASGALALLLALAAVAGPAGAQDQDFSGVEIVTHLAGQGVWMLTGAGGNIGVSAGEDGVFLIDDQYAPLTERIRAAVAKINGKPVRFVLNTHWHGDHTGGNENLGQAGALIVAHENVRQRMSVDQFMERFGRNVPASPAAALPVVTYNDAVTFYLNGDEIHAFHVPPAHTDGDSMIHFKKANVLHMGDVFFNGGYPFIDLGSGGNALGILEAVEQALELADGETKIIPGHGPLTDRAGLVAYRDMLRGSIDKVEALAAEGKSLEEVQAAKPTATFDEAWGGGFIGPDDFVAEIYQSLSGH
jgi:glyoxylase-like metal-dependent hydrolase (beta-lactamase superfamily II)